MFKAYREEFRVEKERINWIDQARGFLMFLLALTIPFPEALLGKDPITAFFFRHPSPKESPWMNAYDVGVPAFFFIIGSLYSLSFLSRMRKKGPGKAAGYALLRWGLIYTAGIIILLLTRTTGLGEMKEIAPGVETFVVSWDVIDSIGFVGLLCIPFMVLSRRSRLIISYGMMSFYQTMLFIPSTYWREYALASVHGGILGGIFVLLPIVLIGSYVGEYYIMETEISRNEKNKKLAIFALLNLVLGAMLWTIPGGYPNKRMSTMSWAAVSLSAIIGGMLVFVSADYEEKKYPTLNPVNKFRITLFKSYGMNPLLIYVLAAISDLFIAALPTELQLAVWALTITAISLIAYALFRKNNIISTMKVSIFVIIILVILVTLLRFSNF